MRDVTYDGPGAWLTLDGRTLVKGEPQSVPDALAKEIENGSDRLKGYKFTVASNDNKES